VVQSSKKIDNIKLNLIQINIIYSYGYTQKLTNIPYEFRGMLESDDEYSDRMNQYEEYKRRFSSVLDYERDILKAGNARPNLRQQYIEREKLLSSLKTKF
jgi:hypothetical protein